MPRGRCRSPSAPSRPGNTTMYDTTLGWRFVNPKMEEMGHTDSLGVTAENLAEERYLRDARRGAEPEEVAAAYDISREAQDSFALRSHEKAVAAMDEKRFREEIVPVTVEGPERERRVVEADEGPRRDTSLEKLAQAQASLQGGWLRHGRQLQLPQRRGCGGAGGLARSTPRRTASSPWQR